MQLRLAKMEDLPKIQQMYREIIRMMKAEGNEIWDDVYPCQFFSEDIQNSRLHILLNDEVLLGAFALCETNEGEAHVRWEQAETKVLYLERLGVNINYLQQGIASALMNHATQIAKLKGIEYLRLFVVDSNTPAIKLYEKLGFTKADGLFVLKIDESLSLNEYGFELKLLINLESTKSRF